MKRKMVWVGIPWLIGLFLASTFRTSATVCLLPAALMLLGAFRLFRHITTKQALCLGISFAAAIGAVLLYTAQVYQPIVSHDGKPSTFSGQVTAVTVYDADKATYQVRGRFSDGTKAKISIYTDDLGARLGDDLDIAGTFLKPQNTYLWNTQSYYRGKSIFLQADSDAFVRCTPTERCGFSRALQAYRENISQRIQILAGTDAGGMVSAMLLGTKDTLAEDTEAVFSHNGMSHVLSVSGLHLVLLLSVWLIFSRKIHLHRWLTFAGCTAWVIAYAMLVNAPISILRAGLMFLIAQSGPLFFRRADTMNSLCIAGILLTIGNPYLITDASFLLSMVGTFGIGVFAPWMTKRIKRTHLSAKLLRNFLAMVCVSVCVFPVTLLYFQEVSVVSPISNIVLVPICSLMLLLSIPIFLTGGIGWIAKPICMVLRLLYRLLMIMGYGLQSLVPTMFPTGWKLLPILVALLTLFVLLVFFQKHRQRAVSAALAVSFVILLAGQASYRLGERSIFQVTAMGKGSEMVVAITYQGRTDILDLTGDHRNPQYVQSYMASNGIRHLSTLCLTKNANQMYVSYPATLPDITADEVVVPQSCHIPTGETVMGATPQYSDAFLLEDTHYTVTVSDKIIQISFGTLQFCIGTKMDTIPDGTWDALICTTWKGDGELLPDQAYCKTEWTQIRVNPNGKISVITDESDDSE